MDANVWRSLCAVTPAGSGGWARAASSCSAAATTGRITRSRALSLSRRLPLEVGEGERVGLGMAGRACRPCRLHRRSARCLGRGLGLAPNASVRRAIVVASMPVWSRSSHAARAESPQPSTAIPLRCQASTAAHRERLAGARGGPEYLDAIAASRQRLDELPLLLRECAPSVHRHAGRRPIREAHRAGTTCRGAVEQAALECEQLPGRVAPFTVPVDQREDLGPG